MLQRLSFQESTLAKINTMENFISTHFRDLIAFLLVIMCLMALIFLDKKISSSLRRTLVHIIVGCIGFLLRGRT